MFSKVRLGPGVKTSDGYKLDRIALEYAYAHKKVIIEVNGKIFAW